MTGPLLASDAAGRRAMARLIGCAVCVCAGSLCPKPEQAGVAGTDGTMRVTGCIPNLPSRVSTRDSELRSQTHTASGVPVRMIFERLRVLT